MNTPQFADDQMHIANEWDYLEYMAIKLQEENKQSDLEINTKKNVPLGPDGNDIPLKEDDLAECAPTWW